MSNNLAGATETIASHLHPIPSWELEQHPAPNGREEVWRFTPLKRLRGLQADAEFTGTGLRVDANQLDGVRLFTVTGADAAEWHGASGYVPTDRMTTRVLTQVDSVLVVDVDAQAEVAEPLLLTLHGQDLTPTAQRLVIRAGEQSKSTVVLRHTGSASLAQVVEVIAGDASELTLVSLQDWADDAVQLSQHAVQVGRDARVRHISASLGGDLVRQNIQFRYAGPGGSVESFGIYFTDAGQHQEHRLFVDHNAPATHSAVDYRGALQGKGAHAVWVGDVLIRKVAEGISTYEANKNLLLTEGCRADSIPNLEIETGQIEGAGHSSTTGRFDDEQLFYLMSRGIDEISARRLVVQGFFNDIIRRIGVPVVEDRLHEALERELEAMTGTQADQPSDANSPGEERAAQ